MLRLFWIFVILKFTCARGSSQAGCIHGGVKFKHGEHFLPSDPLVRAELPGQCVQCRCQEGLVICEMENCPHVSCDSPVRMNHYCCPQCPGATQSKEKTSSINFQQGNASSARRKNGCMSGGKHYKEGSVWQPTIGPLGVMACVQCTCKSNQLTCQRYKCHEPPCSRPKKQFGFCCPVCPVREKNEKVTRSCLPRASEVFVFKTSPSSNSDERIEFAFMKDSSSGKIELHSWNIHAGINSALLVSIISKTDLPPLQLTLLGATSYKHWLRFTRREKRLQHKCAVQCADKVSRLQDTLKLYPVAMRAFCYHDELDTSVL